MLKATHIFSSYTQPVVHASDIRHVNKEGKEDDQNNRLFSYDPPSMIGEGSQDPVPSGKQQERRGTIHLVHLWEAQGHPAAEVSD